MVRALDVDYFLSFLKIKVALASYKGDGTIRDLKQKKYVELNTLFSTDTWFKSWYKLVYLGA